MYKITRNLTIKPKMMREHTAVAFVSWYMYNDKNVTLETPHTAYIFLDVSWGTFKRAFVACRLLRQSFILKNRPMVKGVIVHGLDGFNFVFVESIHHLKIEGSPNHLGRGVTGEIYNA